MMMKSNCNKQSNHTPNPDWLSPNVSYLFIFNKCAVSERREFRQACDVSMNCIERRHCQASNSWESMFRRQCVLVTLDSFCWFIHLNVSNLQIIIYEQIFDKYDYENHQSHFRIYKFYIALTMHWMINVVHSIHPLTCVRCTNELDNNINIEKKNPKQPNKL